MIITMAALARTQAVSPESIFDVPSAHAETAEIANKPHIASKYPEIFCHI
jgi:hypothetical protein